MELQKVLSNIEQNIFKDIVLQLQKDIELSGLEYSLESFSPKELYFSLLKFLEKESKNNSQGVMNLLYRVDIKEIFIHQTAKKLNTTFEEALAICILNRTIEKVQFRKKFNI